MKSPEAKSEAKFITKRQLCERWGRSHMFIQRLLESDPDFPRPSKFGPTENAWWMWPVNAIQNYEKLCAARSVPARRTQKRRAGSGPRS
jgi:predicted DNA-binding transcriptional regulator AlpA